MSWTTPLTWTAGVLYGAADFNAQVRDNQTWLATQVDTAGGWLRTLLQGFAYSSGQGNTGGAGNDTHLTSFDVTVPAGYLAQPGDSLVIETAWSLVQNANTKTASVLVGGGTEQALFADAVSVANNVVQAQHVITRRTSTTGSVSGWALADAADQGTATKYHVNAVLGAVAWANSQTLSFWAKSSAASAGDIKLLELYVWGHLVSAGVTV